jgi:hypothetical protein
VQIFPFRFYAGSFCSSKLRNFLNAGKLERVKGRDEFVTRARQRDKEKERTRGKKKNEKDEGQKKKHGGMKRWKERAGGSRNEKGKGREKRKKITWKRDRFRLADVSLNLPNRDLRITR